MTAVFVPRLVELAIKERYGLEYHQFGVHNADYNEDTVVITAVTADKIIEASFSKNGTLIFEAIGNKTEELTITTKGGKVVT